jgi:hypothetical protein
MEVDPGPFECRTGTISEFATTVFWHDMVHVMTFRHVDTRTL